MPDPNERQLHLKQSLTHTSLLRIAQDNQRRYRMKTPSMVDMRRKISMGTLDSVDKERKTHHDIRPEDKEAYDRQDEFLAGSPRNVHGWKWAALVVSLMSFAFLAGLDGTVTATSQATMVHHFSSIETLAFNSTAFFLGAAASLLTWCQLYNLFDVKWIFAAAIATFGLGSTVCGAAPNRNVLIVGRTVSGMGVSGTFASIQTILSLTTNEKERALYMSYASFAWGVGTFLGSIAGGACSSSSATWRWSYYMILCIGALFAPLALYLVPSKSTQSGVALWSRISSIDFMGFLLLSSSFTTLILAINLGGLVHAWTSGPMIALWIAAVLSLAALGVQQSFGWLTPQVLFPVAVTKNAKVVALFFIQGCSVTAFFVPCYFVPLWFRYVRGESAFLSGLRLLPLVGFTAFSAVLCDQIVRRSGHWMLCALTGGVLVIIGGALMYTVDDGTSATAIYGYCILIGSGAGAFLHIPLHAAQELVGPVLANSAAHFITIAQFAAPAVALSITYAVFLNNIKIDITHLLPGDQKSRALDFTTGINGQFLRGLDVRTRHEVVRAVSDDLAKAYVLVITSGALTLVLGALLAWKLPRRAR